MRPLRNTVLALIAVLAFGCKKDSGEAADLGLGYFPNTIGSWIEYQVDSVWRDDPLGRRDTASYRLREKVVEAYYDPSGRLAYRIHRSVRNAEGAWVVRDVWTRTVDNTAAEVTEENLRRLKLSFPVREGRTWDLNVYNVEEELEVTHREIGVPATINGLYFPKTTMVVSTVEPNLIDTVIYQERYADGLGLISRRTQVTHTQFVYPGGNPPPPPIPQTKGTYFTMTIVDRGNE